jgi:hypothetical protein
MGSDTTVGVTYTDPGVVEATVKGATITMGRDLQWTPVAATTVRMESHEVITIRLEEPTDVDGIEADFVHPLVNLLSLATRHTCGILSLRVRTDSNSRNANGIESETARYAHYATVIRDRPVLEQDKVERHELLFSMDTLGFEQTITRWFKMDEALRTVCDLVNSNWREGRYLTTGFLNAATALEGYHRSVSSKEKETAAQRGVRKTIIAQAPEEHRSWVGKGLKYAYQMDYADRVGGLIDRVGPRFESVIGNRHEWTRWVKAGRNSIAHRDPGMVDLEDEWLATIRITESISWLLVFLLLQDLGLNDDDLDNAVRYSWAWKSVQRQLAEAVPSLFA